MKKMLSIAVIAALVLSVSVSAYTVETEEAVADHPQMQSQRMDQKAPQMNEEKQSELAILAEEAGLTLEEYLATLMPEEGQRTGMANRPEMAEKPAMEEREEPTEEQLAEMEAKKAEMEEKMAEKRAELEALAEEAGLTLEEYMETLTDGPVEGQGPQMGGMMQNGQKNDQQGAHMMGGQQTNQH